MKVLQLVGHFQKWNLDTYYQNSISDGFIFCAYSFPYGYFDAKKINGYDTADVLSKSFIDLQFFAKKEAGNISKGKLNTYDFHPAANADDGNQTNIWIEGLVKRAIKYQVETLGLNNVIIPSYYENNRIEQLTGNLKSINRWLSQNKVPGVKYYMTVAFTHHTIIDEDKVENILYHLTDIDIEFDGYYIVCESKPDTMQKVSTDFKYLRNLSTVLSVLKKQKFTTIYAYANWDAILFLSLTDIDYITIGTYENLRNFSIKRFTVNEDGGPSKGWYFSEKILNMIKAPLLDLIRQQQGESLIKNEKNIFSDAVLVKGYPWSNQKPEVHKNYLLATERLLKEIGDIKDLKERKKMLLQRIDSALSTYQSLESKNIFLSGESKNYHLEIWKSFLLSQK